MQTNPHQLRAAHALKVADDVRKRDNEGDAVSGFPALILRCGLLASLAFALEKKKDGTPKRDAHKRIADAIADYLTKISTGEYLVSSQTNTGEDLLKKLSESDSALLRRCTTEALEFLTYLKRFAR